MINSLHRYLCNNFGRIGYTRRRVCRSYCPRRPVRSRCRGRVAGGTVTYKVDKMTFIVTPVYKKTGKTVHELLLNLMARETGNP
jgi:hypothetical protein